MLLGSISNAFLKDISASIALLSSKKLKPESINWFNTIEDLLKIVSAIVIASLNEFIASKKGLY